MHQRGSGIHHSKVGGMSQKHFKAHYCTDCNEITKTIDFYGNCYHECGCCSVAVYDGVIEVPENWKHWKPCSVSVYFDNE